MLPIFKGAQSNPDFKFTDFFKEFFDTRVIKKIALIKLN